MFDGSVTVRANRLPDTLNDWFALICSEKIVDPPVPDDMSGAPDGTPIVSVMLSVVPGGGVLAVRLSVPGKFPEIAGRAMLFAPFFTAAVSLADVACGVGVAVGFGVAVGCGVAVGFGVGEAVGFGVAVGGGVGEAVGFGVAVGCGVGEAVGFTVGVAVGCGVGVAVGCAVGVAVGCAVGVAVGCAVGVAVGCAVGVAVGCAVGVAVGCGDAVGEGSVLPATTSNVKTCETLNVIGVGMTGNVSVVEPFDDVTLEGASDASSFPVVSSKSSSVSAGSVPGRISWKPGMPVNVIVCGPPDGTVNQKSSEKIALAAAMCRRADCGDGPLPVAPVLLFMVTVVPDGALLPENVTVPVTPPAAGIASAFPAGESACVLCAAGCGDGVAVAIGVGLNDDEEPLLHPAISAAETTRAVGKTKETARRCARS